MVIDERRVHEWTNKVNAFIDNSRNTVGAILMFFFIAVFIQAAFHRFASTSEEVKYLRAAVEKLSNKVYNTSFDEKFDIFDNSEVKMNALKEEINHIMSTVTNVVNNDERFDFALKGVGGEIISYHDSKLLYDCSMLRTLSGFCNEINPPSKAIQSSIEPGEKFCFKGNQGSLTIKLACNIAIDSVTIDHINQLKAPMEYITEAPKEFSLTALKTYDDPHGYNFGKFTFDPLHSSQTFQLFGPSNEKYRYIKINITENYGNEEKTCLYRIRVHGFVDEC